MEKQPWEIDFAFMFTCSGSMFRDLFSPPGDWRLLQPMPLEAVTELSDHEPSPTRGKSAEASPKTAVKAKGKAKSAGSKAAAKTTTKAKAKNGPGMKRPAAKPAEPAATPAELEPVDAPNSEVIKRPAGGGGAPMKRQAVGPGQIKAYKCKYKDGKWGIKTDRELCTVWALESLSLESWFAALRSSLMS